jgi:DNA-binding IclR family transcriptional regulator
MTPSSTKANAVEKALKILLVLSNNEHGLGTGELSDELGFTLPTVSRLLNTLAKHDFVRKSTSGNKYVLGQSALHIGRNAFRHLGTQLIPIVKPYIEEIRDHVKESAMLEVLRGNNAIIIQRSNGPHVIDIMIGEGTMIPAHVSAAGKAILAFSPPETIRDFLKKPLPRFTPKTQVDPADLKKTFEEIRRTGVSPAHGEYNPDVYALGAPVFDKDRHPIAGIVITMPAFRWRLHDPSELETFIRTKARAVTEQIIRLGL